MSGPLPPLLLKGDCFIELKRIPHESVDAVVTDPPYGLEFMGKGWDGADGFRRSLNPEDVGRDNVFGRSSRTSPEYRAGHLFEEWTTEWALECFRILKPGGHMLAFGGSRTWHRLAAGIEDAGFEIRDSIAWIYGSGFPKSMNPGCRCNPIDSEGEPEPKAQHSMSDLRDADVPAAEGSTRGAGAILQSSVPQPSAPERRAAPELDQVRGGEPSVEGRRHGKKAKGKLSADGYRDLPTGTGDDAARERADTDSPARHGAMGRASADSGGVRESYRSRHDEQRAGEPRTLADEPGSQTRRSGSACPRCGKPMVEGLGTALKPAFEPIVVARKPLGEKTVAANVLAFGTGALNIDATRIGSEGGTSGGRGGGMHQYDGFSTLAQLRAAAERGEKCPRGQDARATLARVERNAADANVVETGRWPANVALDESQAAALDEQSGTGGSSRFFYVAKAPKSERPVVDGTGHPTVKPLALMRYLCRLVCAPGGVIVDPFAGSGATLEAAYLEGFESIGVEMTADYWPLIAARIARVTA